MNNDIVRKLKAVKENDTVLLWGGVFGSPGLARRIAAAAKASRKYMWIWNTIGSGYPARRMTAYKRDYRLFTFDRDDAAQYGLRYKDQVYCLNQGETQAAIKYDFYFAGFNKNREHVLNDLQRALEKNYTCHFVIKPDRLHFADFDYQENLRNVLESRCIVDIVKEGQTGLTIRVMESVFYHKKLLTNNAEILNSDLYHENNVFILGRDRIEDLDSFMEKAVAPVSEDILKRLDINEWLREFL
jgi:hypothetical protein